MARIKRLSLEQLTEFDGTTVTPGHHPNDNGVDDLASSSGKAKNTQRSVWNRFYLKLRNIKNRRRGRVVHQQLAKLDDRLLNDIGVTFELQTPGDHRLRVVSRYTFTELSDIKNKGINASRRKALSTHKDSVKHTLQVAYKLPSRAFQLAKVKLVDREACRQMLKLDDYQLTDIGLCREDVIWARQQKRATLALQRLVIARQQKGHGNGNGNGNSNRKNASTPYFPDRKTEFTPYATPSAEWQKKAKEF